MGEQLREPIENNSPQQEGGENNRLIPILEQQPEAIKKMQQMMVGRGSGSTIKQCVYTSTRGNSVNATICIIQGEDPIIFSSYAPSNKDWKTIPAEVNPLEKEEYKPKKVELGENNLIVDQNEQTLENAERIMGEFLVVFQRKLIEGGRLLENDDKVNKIDDKNKSFKIGNTDFTKPVLELFRDYTIFKGTVFGKNGTGLDYAKTYFSHFIEKKPVKVELDGIKEFAFTKDGLVTIGDYIFTTQNGQKIRGSFFMLIGEDKRGYHFKTFHSAEKKVVIKNMTK